MAVKKRLKTKAKSLSHGRPPVLAGAKVQPQSLTSKATRTLIRNHHRLQKEHAAAIKAGETTKASQLEKEIEKNGGLPLYQAASIKGQSAERGGDSSRVLVEWLKEDGIVGKDANTSAGDDAKKCAVLEVGALSPSNAIARAPALHITRIDLHSQDPAIETQDFMDRPLPDGSDGQFDIISLSLVLNYVTDATARGEMLKRTCKFLRASPPVELHPDGLPALFLVLPAPCVKNSRYLTEKHLLHIMRSLGYQLKHKKISPKLVYYLWRYNAAATKAMKVPKKKLSNGREKNNFCIVLE
jgi:25S rRNA (adenine2142-N1)-methyltransferase